MCTGHADKVDTSRKCIDGAERAGWHGVKVTVFNTNGEEVLGNGTLV